MFLFITLAGIGLSKTSADLTPPFETNKDGNVGHWEFGGSAGVRDDVIMLVPPIQYNMGCAWTNVQIPSGVWSVTYKLRIYDGTGGGGGFGIWFVDTYGAHGKIHGGPQNFKGIGLSGSVITDARNSHSLKLSFLQNDGTETFDISNLPDPVIYKFRRANVFTIKFKFVQKNLIISISDSDEFVDIFKKEIAVPYENGYIGITANTDAHTCRIDLHSIEFNIDEENEPDSDDFVSRKVHIDDNNNPNTYEPDFKGILRNPIFNKTAQAIDIYFSPNARKPTEATADQVLDIVGEMCFVSYFVSSFSELNDYIRGTLGPYTQKWHRRTVRMVENVKKARNVFELAFNSTDAMVKAMNSTLATNLVKTTLKVVDLVDLINDEAENEINEVNNEISQISESSLVKSLGLIAIIELVLVSLFLILSRNSNFRAKVLRL
ncbi:Legume-like lectin family protein [Histomonas meleagridis]|uniref:Legume-like lectin family protein n=1 Tax=Histomonas meleagridis TaxID=135588 RepID=UPI0035593BC0|nr:Legume-like lectin family protein [Histomonas meleagridis]KAH0800836.1 Legume-like lectin family protein [Histomonas meleagridis]